MGVPTANWFLTLIAARQNSPSSHKSEARSGPIPRSCNSAAGGDRDSASVTSDQCVALTFRRGELGQDELQPGGQTPADREQKPVNLTRDLRVQANPAVPGRECTSSACMRLTSPHRTSGWQC